MFGTACSPCCAGCQICQYRISFGDFDNGVDECEERVPYVFPNGTQRAGVRCGEFAARHTPGLYFREAFSSVGYGDIVQNEGGGSRVISVGPTGFIPFSSLPPLLTSASISRSESGWEVAPQYTNNGNTQVAGRRRIENCIASFNLSCFNNIQRFSISLDLSLSVIEYLSATDIANWLVTKTRNFIGPAIGVSQVTAGGAGVAVSVALNGFTFGDEFVPWTSSSNTANVPTRDTATEIVAGIPEPSPGPMLDEVVPFDFVIYDPGRGCCDSTYCEEQNPLP